MPSLTPPPATPYRYSVLIDRAKQLAQQAMQMEAAFLSALEKADKEAYDLMNAKADLRLAQAGVRLQDLQVQQAQDGVELAQLQRERASIQSTTYGQWISAGLSPNQQQLLGWYDWLAGFQIAASQFAAIDVGNHWRRRRLCRPRLLRGGYLSKRPTSASGSPIIGDQRADPDQRLSVMISLEQRVQDWTLQKALADQDIRIGDQQVQIANDQVRIAQQQHVIDQMKADHAKRSWTSSRTNSPTRTCMIG